MFFSLYFFERQKRIKHKRKILSSSSNSIIIIHSLCTKARAEINAAGANFSSAFVREVGQWMKSTSTKERWLGDSALFTKFLRLYALDLVKDYKVRDMVE